MTSESKASSSSNVKGFRRLLAHQRGDELAFQVYLATKDYPPEEQFGLVSQMRRAAISVPANIAEGYARNGAKDKTHFYNIATASLSELEYYLDFSLRLRYMSQKQYSELVELRGETGKLLHGLIRPSNQKR